MTTQREADLSPELVAIAIEAFNREGGKRAASQFLWTIAEPQMKAALTAALPLLEKQVREDERERILRLMYEQAKAMQVWDIRCHVERFIEGFADRCALDLTQHSQKVDP